MADWEANFTNQDLKKINDQSQVYIVDKDNHSNHSRQSSDSSGLMTTNKENRNIDRSDSIQSSNSGATDKELILRGGDQLTGESKTEFYTNGLFRDTLQLKNGMSSLEIPSRPANLSSGSGTAKAKAAKSPYTAGGIDSIPEEEIEIPNDANISGFTSDQLANFFRCLKIDDRIIAHLHKKSVDGKRFSKLKDSELENLNMKNPIIVFFRDKSNKAGRRKTPFML